MEYKRVVLIKGKKCVLTGDDTCVRIEGRNQYTIPINSITAIRMEPDGIDVYTHICYNGGTIEIENDLSDLAAQIQKMNPSIIVTYEKPTTGAYIKHIIGAIIGFIILGWFLNWF